VDDGNENVHEFDPQIRIEVEHARIKEHSERISLLYEDMEQHYERAFQEYSDAEKQLEQAKERLRKLEDEKIRLESEYAKKELRLRSWVRRHTRRPRYLNWTFALLLLFILLFLGKALTFGDVAEIPHAFWASVWKGKATNYR
jgi:ferric-dicitrate binding protein FerR (iron transport regulator)